MTKFVLLYNQFTASIEGNSAYTYGIIALIGITFIIQIYYYLYYYITIIKRSKREKPSIREKESLSVIIVVRNNLYWVESILPLILAQKCTKFEVIAIDMGEDTEVSDLLESLKKLYSHLIVTSFTHNPKFPISNKMALNVGIKCATTNNILLTTTQSRPLSEFWLAEFINAFSKSDVILGYTGVEREDNSFITKLVRLTRVLSAMRCLSSAINGKPYKGYTNNLAFRKDLYFKANGFNFLNMNIGENDLFLQKIATPNNTSVLITKNSLVVESLCGDLSSCRAARRYIDYTFKFFPKGLKFSIISERLIRSIFFISILLGVVFLPLPLKLAVIGVAIIRIITVMVTLNIISRKFGESHILSALPLHDIIYPIDSLIMYIHRLTRPIRSIWR